MVEWVTDFLGTLSGVDDTVLACACVCVCFTLAFIYKLLARLFSL